MLQDIADTAAKITKKASFVKNEVSDRKTKLERWWRYFVDFVETFWGLCKKSLAKVEQGWCYFKNAVENAWNSFWGIIPGFENATEVSLSDALLSIPIEEGNRDNIRRLGINIGLLYVDKKKYGQDAYCPGCDRDAISMNRILNKYGFETRLFLNNDATWYNIKTQMEKWANILENGDLLVITVAGHGGQVRDTNNDEADGLDETWLLFDREVPDDDILDLIKKFKPGVRIVMINDQCHSEGNFRSFVRGVQRAVSLGYWGKREGHPIVQEEDIDGQISVSREEGPSLIQFAGCRENNVSYGSSNGGEWTSALIQTFDSGLSWRQWFETASKVPRKQSPQWVEYGPVTDSFRNGKVFK